MIELALNLDDPGLIADPYPQLAELREQAAAFYDPRWRTVFFTRHADIVALLRDRRLGRPPPPGVGRAELGLPEADPARAVFDAFEGGHLMSIEPPEHSRLKRLMAKAFTPQRAEALRSTVGAIVGRLLDAAAPAGQFDLLRDLAEPLPVAVIAELLGLPAADRPMLRPWSAAIVKLYELDHTQEQVAAAVAAVREFSSCLAGLLAHRRRQPGDDLISALARVEEGGLRLSDDQVVYNCMLLLNAGHEATANAITGAALALFRHPAQLAQLRAAATSPDSAALWRTAVDELLRYDTPLPLFKRWAWEDGVYAGQPLARGTAVGLLYASGNRDPRRFAQPDELLLDRRDNQHLSFGHSTHFCLGAPLAQIEIQVALQALLLRFPKLRPVSQHVEYGGGFVIRGLRALPVHC